jgi:hypothetical protein
VVQPLLTLPVICSRHGEWTLLVGPGRGCILSVESKSVSPSNEVGVPTPSSVRFVVKRKLEGPQRRRMEVGLHAQRHKIALTPFGVVAERQDARHEQEVTSHLPPPMLQARDLGQSQANRYGSQLTGSQSRGDTLEWPKCVKPPALPLATFRKHGVSHGPGTAYLTHATDTQDRNRCRSLGTISRSATG